MKESNECLVAMESMRGFEFQSAFQRDETESIIGGGSVEMDTSVSCSVRELYLYAIRICGGDKTLWRYFNGFDIGQRIEQGIC